ncbi:MAG: hypothetical protein KGJ57_22990 [Sphingomonadales bacterium]|nr:hypothetical protein [Sphingomonadales bacterium]MDE2172253.1 hypothetical protein [Sphingomonadales bacterium]
MTVNLRWPEYGFSAPSVAWMAIGNSFSALAKFMLQCDIEFAFQASSPKLSKGWSSGWAFFCPMVCTTSGAALLPTSSHYVLICGSPDSGWSPCENRRRLNTFTLILMDSLHPSSNCATLTCGGGRLA